MFKAILQIVAALAPPLAKLWSNKIDKDNSPDEKAKKSRLEMGTNIIKGDSAAESARINDLVRGIKNADENHS